MKKTISILSTILTLSLLSACGSSGNDAPSSELLFEQPATEEETSSELEEFDTDFEEKAQEPEEPKEDTETDPLTFYVIHSVREAGNPKKNYFYFVLGGDYSGFGTGILFLDDGYQRPYWLKKESPDATSSSPVHIEGEIGESIQKSFEDMYTNDLADYDAFFDEKFNEIAQEVVNSKCHDRNELSEKIGLIDVTDEVPKELSFVTKEGETIKLPIVSANIRNDFVDSVPIDFELADPSWDDGEKRYGLSNIAVMFDIPRESMDELRAYLSNEIKAATGDSNDEQIVVAEEKAESQSELIPEGKNFDNVTGFEGYWYNKTTGELDFVLFSDGTALETDNYGGNVYLVDYDVNMEWKMVYIHGVNDIYYCDIIDANTLGGDAGCVRKPYEGGLENLTFKTKNW